MSTKRSHLPNLQTLGILSETDHLVRRAHLDERKVGHLGELGGQRRLARVGWSLKQDRHQSGTFGCACLLGVQGAILEHVRHRKTPVNDTADEVTLERFLRRTKSLQSGQ